MEFLPKEAIKDPASLDAILVEMHKAYEANKVPMAEDQTRASIAIMTAPDAGIDEMYNDLLAQSWQFAGFFKRCEIFPIKYETRLKLWLAVMHYEFGLGGMILVAYYVQWFCYRQLKIKWALSGGVEEVANSVNLSFVCKNCFPLGLFTKETVHEFWDKQKVEGRPDNLIDYPSTGVSFMPIERTEPINSKDHVFF